MAVPLDVSDGRLSVKASVSRHRRQDRKRKAELRFPHKMDIAVRRDGVSGRITAMIDWCEGAVSPDDWECHEHRETSRARSMLFTRFYFKHKFDAEAFRRKWPARGTRSQH